MAGGHEKPGFFTRRILEGLNLAQYFEVVVGAESVQRKKPDPEAIQLILAKLGAPPETTLVVGDASTDIQAAKAAKTISCGVTYGYGSRQEILGAYPDFVIDRAEQLSPLIL